MLLNIEKLIYGGDGLARLPADERGRGKAVFAPFVLAGEKVEAALTEEKSGFARAQLKAIVEPSPYRVAPGCPHFGRCGGCHYQHASYEHKLEIKREILRENLRRIAKLELQSEIMVHPSPPWNYRNRSRLQVQTAPEFAAGYYKLRSHALLPVEECPISSPLVNRGIAALWATGRAGKAAAGVAEVEFFANAEDTELLVEVSCRTEARRAAVREWAEELITALPEIQGVAAFRDTKQETQETQEAQEAQETLLHIGAGELTYRTRQAAFRVSAGAFFQTNRHLIDELVSVVTAGCSGELAVDFYAGVGLFSTALACNFRHIVSVESSQTAAADLAHNLPTNGEAVRAATEHYLKREFGGGRTDRGTSNSGKLGGEKPGEDKRDRDKPGRERPDLVVVDPPRGGLGEAVARAVADLSAPRITYVSCDPATLARDLVMLLGAGYRVEEAHLIDLFPQTYHLESVMRLVR